MEASGITQQLCFAVQAAYEGLVLCHELMLEFDEK